MLDEFDALQARYVTATEGKRSVDAVPGRKLAKPPGVFTPVPLSDFTETGDPNVIVVLVWPRDSKRDSSSSWKSDRLAAQRGFNAQNILASQEQGPSVPIID